MVNYNVYLYSKAKKEYYKLDNTIKEKIKQRLFDLEKDPFIGTHLKKVDYWKLRVEDYRVIYQIKDKQHWQKEYKVKPMRYWMKVIH